MIIPTSHIKMIRKVNDFFPLLFLELVKGIDGNCHMLCMTQ